jgi:hypothetical protein
MHRPVSRPFRPVAVVLAAAAILALTAGPVAAKEGMTATLDAPIPMGTPGGTELLVGVTVTVPDETGAEHPVEGTPVYLALVGRDGATTRAMGVADRTPGHYTMRIVVPQGGARGIEVGIHGTSDLAIMVAGDTLVLGDVTATTAQVAPPLAPALTPFPRAANPDANPAPEAMPAPVAAEPAMGPPLLAALVIGGLVLLAGGLVLVRRRRATAAVPAATSAPRSA